MSHVSFATENDYLKAKSVVKGILAFAMETGKISVEYQYGRDNSLVTPLQALDRLAYDIVSGVARSNVVVSGDIDDLSEVKIDRVTP